MILLIDVLWKVLNKVADRSEVPDGIPLGFYGADNSLKKKMKLNSCLATSQKFCLAYFLLHQFWCWRRVWMGAFQMLFVFWFRVQLLVLHLVWLSEIHHCGKCRYEMNLLGCQYVFHMVWMRFMLFIFVILLDYNEGLLPLKGMPSFSVVTPVLAFIY